MLFSLSSYCVAVSYFGFDCRAVIRWIILHRAQELSMVVKWIKIKKNVFTSCVCIRHDVGLLIFHYIIENWFSTHGILIFDSSSSYSFSLWFLKSWTNYHLWLIFVDESFPFLRSINSYTDSSTRVVSLSFAFRLIIDLLSYHFRCCQCKDVIVTRICNWIWLSCIRTLSLSYFVIYDFI